MLPMKVSFPGRRFQLWSYTVSHAQMLLRSTKTDALPTRIDVLFKNVAAMCLPVGLNGLKIEEVPASAIPEISSVAAADALFDQAVYKITADDSASGWVICGVVAWHEDRGEHYDPSALMPELWM